MAMTTTMMPSPPVKSAFSPFTDSPSSPAPYSVSFRSRSMQRASTGSDRDSLAPPPSPYPATVDPSPVDSNDSHSTDVTDIDQDDLQSPGSGDDAPKSPDIEIMSPMSNHSERDEVAPLHLVPLDTNVFKGADDGPQSVIHAPQGFKQFKESKRSPPLRRNRSISSPSETSDNTVVSPTTPECQSMPDEKRLSNRDTAPINTQVPAARMGAGATPRASTLQEAEEEWGRRSRMSNNNLEDIEEAEDLDRPDSPSTSNGHSESISDALRNLNSPEQDVAYLNTALSNCWTLTNTLANLSSGHRERMFSFHGSGDGAWKSCWRLCQNLYESRHEDHASHVRPTLELCREFCQALFEARHRDDEVLDSILRVSFELNNHLYNTHDRNLPQAFKERTLDFYLTMCHRLMKQRTSLPEETDALLRACWSLAELLFSLRQNNRDGKPVDQELLGSAVQACWELCDLFREGWAQIRPERGTPKPVQRVFPAQTYTEQNYATNHSSTNQVPSSRPSSSLSGTFHSARSLVPETPTTIFDDRDEASPSEMAVPNILVLGPDPSAMGPPGRGMTQNRWSSNSSVSSYSESSQRTATSVGRASASTPTPQQQQLRLEQQEDEDNDPHQHVLRLKALILKAAVNVGFGRQSPTTLTAFVKTLPATAFGQQPWQVKLFESYRKLVLTDPNLRGDHRQFLPTGRRMTANDIRPAVQEMTRRESFIWFRDLFRLVFQFDPEETSGKKGAGFQI